jgi:predicted metal-dependent hydrolase
MRYPDLTVNIVRSNRKTLAIHVFRDGRVEVRAPLVLADQTIQAFIVQKTGWVHRKRAELQARPPIHAIRYAWGEKHDFLGIAHWLVSETEASDDAGGTPQIRLLLPRGADAASIEKTLYAWYRRRAAEVFAERFALWLQKIDHWPVKKPSLQIRRMRRRWGSCRSNGVITLNLELIRFPLVCLDAVIAHELCHLREMNHSKRFYVWLDQLCPEWRQADALLR